MFVPYIYDGFILIPRSISRETKVGTQSKIQPISGKPQNLHFTGIPRLKTWLDVMQLVHSLLWRTLRHFPTSADNIQFDYDEQCDSRVHRELKTNVRRQQDAGSQNRLRKCT